MTEPKPICEECDETFIEYDDIIIFNGSAYHKDCLHEVAGTILYFRKGGSEEFIGEDENADFEGVAYEKFDGLEEETE
ncbi:hypothetical protein HB818_14325 [Listeria booriae]|uniref:hypothetical protein n=1 Tax=Listeria booriae TaxID=1552123 RepID=UPI0016297A56|nr:hypothetical protein [Listeria booriae]MBC1286935.1 hypothetical protein [Listeria booriae]